MLLVESELNRLNGELLTKVQAVAPRDPCEKLFVMPSKIIKEWRGRPNISGKSEQPKILDTMGLYLRVDSDESAVAKLAIQYEGFDSESFYYLFLKKDHPPYTWGQVKEVYYYQEKLRQMYRHYPSDRGFMDQLFSAYPHDLESFKTFVNYGVLCRETANLRRVGGARVG
jgi:hypothetical protein